MQVVLLLVRMSEATPYPHIPSMGRRQFRKMDAAKRGRMQSLAPGESLREQQVGSWALCSPAFEIKGELVVGLGGFHL